MVLYTALVFLGMACSVYSQHANQPWSLAGTRLSFSNRKRNQFDQFGRDHMEEFDRDGRLIRIARDAARLDRVTRDTGRMDRITRDTGRMDGITRDTGRMDRITRDTGRMDRIARDAGRMNRITRDAGRMNRITRDTGRMDRMAKDIGRMNRITKRSKTAIPRLIQRLEENVETRVGASEDENLEKHGILAFLII